MRGFQMFLTTLNLTLTSLPPILTGLDCLFSPRCAGWADTAATVAAAAPALTIVCPGLNLLGVTMSYCHSLVIYKTALS